MLSESHLPLVPVLHTRQLDLQPSPFTRIAYSPERPGHMHAISPSCLPSSRYWTRPFSAKRMADLNSFLKFGGRISASKVFVSSIAWATWFV